MNKKINKEITTINSTKNYKEVFIEGDLIAYYQNYSTEDMCEDFSEEEFMLLLGALGLILTLRTQASSEGEMALELSQLLFKVVNLLKNSSKLSLKNLKEFLKSIPKSEYITFLAAFGLMIAFRTEFFSNGFRIRKFRKFLTDNHLSPIDFNW